MTEKTKQLIDDMEYELEEQENSRQNAMSKSKLYRKDSPEFLYDYPIYKDLKDIIIYSDLSKVCPRRWDELEVNFDDSTKRYSEHLDDSILKITNVHNYNQIKEQNISISIPYNGVLQQKLSNNLQQYIKEYAFIQISRRIMMNSGYNKEYDINLIDKNEAIKFILSYIENDIKDSSWKDMDSWRKQYNDYDIDLDEVINNHQ